jgi:hypothetical protein
MNRNRSSQTSTVDMRSAQNHRRELHQLLAGGVSPLKTLRLSRNPAFGDRGVMTIIAALQRNKRWVV